MVVIAHLIYWIWKGTVYNTKSYLDWNIIFADFSNGRQVHTLLEWNFDEDIEEEEE